MKFFSELPLIYARAHTMSFRGDEGKKERKQFLLVGRLIRADGINFEERKRDRESYAVYENKSEKCYESGKAKVADNLLIL